MTTTDVRPGVKVQGEGPSPRVGLSPEERGEKAAALAREVVGAVHFGTRKDVALLLHRQDLVALTVALAAMVDPDRSVGELLAWTTEEPFKVRGRHEVVATVDSFPTAEPRRPSLYRPDEELLPCGTHAAFVRHKNRNEPVDDACREGERAYQRERHQRRRQRERVAA